MSARQSERQGERQGERPGAIAPALGRRGFLEASGGLVIACGRFGPAAADAAASARGSAAPGNISPPPAGKLYAWLAVNPDNSATLFTAKVETGTGVATALARIPAEELDFPVDKA